MSSHREAPEISKDPVADSTDLYAFVSPDAPSTVTLIANYLPLEGPAAGPNFYEFGEDVLYEILIDNNGDARPDISFQFQFQTTIRNEKTFLYNTGPIQSLNSPNWNRVQTYSLQRVDYPSGRVTVLGTDLPCPPCNVGPLSTPNYESVLGAAAIQSVGGGIKAFAGQRAEGFYVDLGSIFDLGTLRPFQQLHATFGVTGPLSAMAGINSTNTLNVHSLALQIPKDQLTAGGLNPTDPTKQSSVIGVWTAASRKKVKFNESFLGEPFEIGPWAQVSRLGNPLFNEVIVPMALKDFWNSSQPVYDSQFAKYVADPELANLLPVLYTPPTAAGPAEGAFPKLYSYNNGSPNRVDLLAILLTGIPAGTLSVAPTFQNFTGPTQADMLRLNMAIGPSSAPNTLGLLALDAAGFPNGRRVFDDVVTIELRCVAGVLAPGIVPGFPNPGDGAAGAIYDLVAPGTDTTLGGTENYLPNFPYLGVPHSGYNAPSVAS
jgi:Domain of unknown function (DUF4331)